LSQLEPYIKIVEFAKEFGKKYSLYNLEKNPEEQHPINNFNKSLILSMKTSAICTNRL